MSSSVRDRLTEVRRRFHRHPDPAWREFYTTACIVEELERIGIDVLTETTRRVKNERSGR